VRAARRARFALLFHRRVEDVTLDGEPPLGCELLGQLDRKAVGVVEAEGDLAREAARRSLGGFGHCLFEEGEAGAQRPVEPALLSLDDLLDEPRFSTSTGYARPITSTADAARAG